MGRDGLIKIAQEQLRLIDTGTYIIYSIKDEINKMIAGTVSHKDIPEIEGLSLSDTNTCKITVSNKDTISAILDKKKLNDGVCALNFASAKHPGGGFESGALAQEECLCYCSTLFGSLREQTEVYEESLNNLNNGLYSNWTIYSPNVSIVRDSKYRFIVPAKCSFITSPAPNAKVYLNRRKGNEKDLAKALYKRCELVLKTAALHGEKNLILGAFGCGVFGNDPNKVAETFKRLLIDEGYAGYFDSIEFAILTRSGDNSNFNAFKRCFG